MEAPSVLLYDYNESICCQMVRVALAEKGVSYEKRPVDIIETKEQFELWYLELNPKGVVPTLVVNGEVFNDTLLIVPHIDDALEGPSLSPTDPEARARMQAWMRDLMAVRYGVLLYSRKLDADRRSETIVGRGEMLRRLATERPEAAAVFERRIEGNRKLQATLADPAAVQQVKDGVADLVQRMDAALVENSFLVDDTYSLADAFAAACIGRFDHQGFSHWWSEGRLPNLAAYYERLRARPSWAEAGVIGG